MYILDRRISYGHHLVIFFSIHNINNIIINYNLSINLNLIFFYDNDNYFL